MMMAPESAGGRPVSAPNDMDAVAGRVRAALQEADLSTLADLLDPDVHWGAPDDPAPECQNREQVLAWYRQARDAGLRADVTGFQSAKTS